MKNLSLQWRITMLSAIILIICTVTLTALAIDNAETTFMTLITPAQPLLTEPAVPLESAEPLSEGSSAAVITIPAQTAKKSFDTTSILLCAIFTALGTAAVYFVTGRALRPLVRLTEQVNRVDESTLSHHLPAAVNNDEVSRLTAGFNHMLTRLDDAFLRQKRFTANAAHELKTPLAMIKTGAQVLGADKAATIADYSENNDMTIVSVDRLAKVVDDLLLLASADEGDNDTAEVLLEPLFEAIQSELSAQLAAREMNCVVDCGELSINSNASLLYRAFFNLIENACKYGNDGGTITVTATQADHQITILVSDNGQGIPPEHLPYIFDAFYRVDKSRTRAAGGSGLGLSIVKTMIEACGGKIIADSDGTSGSCFTVYLPQ